jgi:alkanesulfonate monooxygenase SsuD/methylene tetrahydromethanopterin reductase-like flavin-dependent oxidoreductase (luciferase family)
VSAGCRLGILLPMVGHGLSASELLAELTDEVCAAEDAGLDLVLVPEHHRGPPGSLTAPLTVATWLLARTSTIRIGTGVLILPLHPTVEVAEEAALLQQASHGRFILGVGAGYQVADFEMYGMNRAGRARRLEQAMIDLRALWSGQPVAGVPLRPSLDGVGPPDLWLGAWSEPGVRRAALHADAWIADPIRTDAEVVAMAAVYRAEASANARNGHVVVIREGFVSASRQAAMDAYGPPATVVYRYYLRRGAFPVESGVTEADLISGAAMHDRLLVGSPEEVASRISSLAAECGAATVVLGLRHPTGPSHHEVMDAIRLLGTEVVPLLSTEGTR